MELMEIDSAKCICHKVNGEKVEKYFENMKKGNIFPPIEVVLKDGLYYVRDGNHRASACKKLNESVWAYVFEFESYPSLHLIGGRITRKGF